MKAQDVTCTIKEIKWLTPTIFQLSFDCSPKITHVAGQFFSVIVPAAGPGGRDLRRAYSIASSPESETLQLCIRKVEGGPGTTYLSTLKAGDQFKGQAPFGHFIFKSEPERNVYFVSTGTGISPFRSMLLSPSFHSSKTNSVTLLFGTTDEKEIVYDSEMKSIKDLNFVIALSRAQSSWNGFRGRVTDYLRSVESNINWSKSDFYLCGNGAMIDEVKAMLTAKGLTKANIFQEVYYKPKGEK